mmetsp:Transcript_14767/g.29111  ORF Transcript_14767/g.29111 Transcript_14767/m.29111 type:complete len:221 (+) Transcript_14767:97-759(+)
MPLAMLPVLVLAHTDCKGRRHPRTAVPLLTSVPVADAADSPWSSSAHVCNISLSGAELSMRGSGGRVPDAASDSTLARSTSLCQNTSTSGRQRAGSSAATLGGEGTASDLGLSRWRAAAAALVTQAMNSLRVLATISWFTSTLVCKKGWPSNSCRDGRHLGSRCKHQLSTSRSFRRMASEQSPRRSVAWGGSIVRAGSPSLTTLCHGSSPSNGSRPSTIW